MSLPPNHSYDLRLASLDGTQIIFVGSRNYNILLSGLVAAAFWIGAISIVVSGLKQGEVLGFLFALFLACAATGLGVYFYMRKEWLVIDKPSQTIRYGLEIWDKKYGWELPWSEIMGLRAAIVTDSDNDAVWEFALALRSGRDIPIAPRSMMVLKKRHRTKAQAFINPIQEFLNTEVL